MRGARLWYEALKALDERHEADILQRNDLAAGRQTLANSASFKAQATMAGCCSFNPDR